MDLVDSLMEDDAERQRLRSKPTCFLVVGRPGVGKSTLAKEIADTWGCVLIDDTILLNFHTRTQTEDGIKLLNILNVGESVPEEMVLQLILDMLNSEKVHHYGYVLSCLPFISEESVEVDRQIELMKNLELKPDFIINIKCADKDLVQRLSGQKQHPETGLMYSQEKWKREGGFHVMEFLDKTEEDVEESEAEDEDEDEKGQTPKITVDQMVWVPEHNAKNTSLRINAYKDTILRPLEDYMMDHNPIYLLELDGNIKPKELLSFVLSRLGSMAIQRVSIPVVLYKDRELPEDIETEDLLRFMSSSRLMVPGCRWRRSRWGRSCPVALKEGRFIPGKPEYSVGFQDKLYILSSHEAFNKFMTNPRRYLLPPMPSPPCRVCIIGVLQSGRSALAKLMAERHNVSVLELEKLAEPLLAQLEQERLDKLRVKGLEAAIANIKLKQQSEEISDDTPVMEVTEDHPEVQALLQTTLDEAKTSRDTSMESLSLAVEKIITENEEANADAKLGSGWVLDNFPRNISQLESLQQAGIYPDFLFCLMCSDGNKTGSADQLDKKEEKGPTDTEEQEAEKVQFMREWEGMQLSLKINRSVLETGNRSPEELLKEIVQLMEKPFKYVPREFSAVDQDEETEDMDALAEMDDDDNDDLSKESEDEKEDEESESSGDATSKRPFGDTFHFCPVVLQKQNTLIPCTDEIAGKYREKVYYFSSQDAREEFLLDPEQFVASTEILKPPAMRIFLLGCRGSGKTTQGQWLAKKLGLFHIQFREQLQLLLMAKTKQRVVSADESMEEHLQAAKDTLKEAVGEEDVETNKEVELTDEEISIKAYLTDGIPLGQHILEKVVSLYWKVEPYRSTGFILEGFPYNTEEVQHVLQHQLYPDVVVSLMAEVTDIQARLLPEYRRRWREHCDQREALFNIVREINRKAREESMVKRRAELMAEKLVASTDTAKFTCRDEDEEEDDSNMEDEIQAILEEEFPLDRDDEFIGDEETTEATDDRLSLEIEERYVSDTNNIASVMELLTELNIPRISINAGRKTALVRRQLLMKVEPLHTNRESLFQKCQPISYMLSQQLLLYSYKFHSAFGCLDPVKRYNEGDVFQPVQWPVDRAYPVLLNQYIYFLESKKNQQTFMLNPLKYLRQSKPSPTLPVKIAIIGPPKSGKTGVAQMFAQKYGLDLLSIGGVMRRVLDTQEHSELAMQMKEHLHQGHSVPDELAIQCLELVLMNLVCCIQGYVLDGFPMTMKQAELMQSHSIVPMIIVEMELETVEVLKRGLAGKTENKPHLVHNNVEIIHIRNTCYTVEAEKLRQHFQQQYDNWIPLDGLKSKWYNWESLIEKLSTSMKHIHTYLQRTRSGQAGCINKLCVTPKEFHQQLGEFGQYCPVCLALNNHLVDCSETASLMLAAEYKRRYFKMCDTRHLELFLATPDQFVTPGCPRPLPEPHLLPKKLTDTDVKNRVQRQFEMEGFCPITYLDGKLRYEALVRGSADHAVEYRERIYACETKQKQYKFLRAPELYWDLQLPAKVPPLCESIPLTLLPTLGYLEQGVAVSVIKAMTAVGCLKPKFPFYSMERSALHYVAFYMKAFNHRSTEHIRQMYKKKLASFEENCTLIPYLSATIKAPYKFPGERPIDFEFKLNKFLALRDSPEDESKL